MVKVKKTLSIPVHRNRDLPTGALKSLFKGGKIKMKGFAYPAIIKYDRVDKVYTVKFPDLPWLCNLWRNLN